MRNTNGTNGGDDSEDIAKGEIDRRIDGDELFMYEDCRENCLRMGGEEWNERDEGKDQIEHCQPKPLLWIDLNGVLLRDPVLKLPSFNITRL